MQNTSKFLKQLSLVYFAVAGLVLFLIILPIILVFKLLSRLTLKAKYVYYIALYLAVKALLAVNLLKYKVKDFDSVSKFGKKKFIIVSNHRSHLDMFIYLSHIVRLRAVANGKLFKIPFFGKMLSVFGHFPLEKGNFETYKKTLQDIGTAFHENYIVLFFPEMTRCLPGEKGLLKFRLTAFQLARENNIPLIPIVISGTDQVWPKGEKNGLDFRKKISVASLDPVYPENFLSSADLSLHIHELMEKKLMELSQ
jgi:1-acyl-sn-glycerol-3-phosphate acyltransferase